MIKVGLFGGTFSPPHVGHRRALEYFIKEEGLSRVFVMPTYIPPHKHRADTTEAEDRFEMCRLAFGDIPQVSVSDLEIRRGGKSYTALTLEALQKDGERLVFLCGTDMFLTLDEWYRPDAIFALADIVCMPRENDPAVLEALREKSEIYREKFRAVTRILAYTPTEISSSEIRAGFETGDAAAVAWIAPSVRDYVLEKGLYGSDGFQQ